MSSGGRPSCILLRQFRAQVYDQLANRSHDLHIEGYVRIDNLNNRPTKESSTDMAPFGVIGQPKTKSFLVLLIYNTSYALNLSFSEPIS